MILICDDVSVDDTEGHDKSFNDDETEVSSQRLVVLFIDGTYHNF
jgi:hypothetical protein